MAVASTKTARLFPTNFLFFQLLINLTSQNGKTRQSLHRYLSKKCLQKQKMIISHYLLVRIPKKLQPHESKNVSQTKEQRRF